MQYNIQHRNTAFRRFVCDHVANPNLIHLINYEIWRVKLVKQHRVTIANDIMYQLQMTFPTDNSLMFEKFTCELCVSQGPSKVIFLSDDWVTIKNTKMDFAGFCQCNEPIWPISRKTITAWLLTADRFVVSVSIVIIQTDLVLPSPLFNCLLLRTATPQNERT